MATIKGRWRFNTSVTASYIGEEVNYTSKGVSYGWMTIQSDYVTFDKLNVEYAYALQNGVWEDQYYRTVDFGETEQTVSDEFYNAFTANANPMPTTTIKGKWHFRDDNNPVGDFYATQKVSFTSRGVPFDTMLFTGDAVHYILEGTHDYGFDGGFLTEDDALYRTVDFGDAEQTVYVDWFLFFVDFAEQVDEDTEQKTVKGKWYFERSNIIVPFDAEQKIRFASGGTLFDTMQFSADPLAVSYIMDGYYTYQFEEGFLTEEDEPYREVDFGDTEQTVSGLWYTVFTANAVERQPEQPDPEQPEPDQPEPDQPDADAVKELQKQIDDLKLKVNELKNTPAFKLLWTAAELQEKMGGILDGTFIGEDGEDGYTPVKGVDYYTEEDKAEMVEAVAEAMPEPSWDNLTDKPFYEEPAVMGKLFECTIPAGQNSLFVGNIGDNVLTSDGSHITTFEDGNTYPVIVNGKSYEANFSCGESWNLVVDEIGLYFRGDNSQNNIGTDVTVTCNDPNGLGTSVDRHVTIDIDVVEKEAVVHTIEPKFTPGVLPVVELTTVINKYEETPLSAKESLLLDEVWELKTPFVLHLNLEGANVATVMTYARNYNAYDEYGLYGCIYDVWGTQPIALFRNSDGTWRHWGKNAP